MSAALIAALGATMVATAFLSGIFGMAGGLILMGVLLALLPLPEAMALHSVTQMASNGWRGLLWLRYVHWSAAATFLAGCAVAFAVWTVWRYVPSKPVAFILLGVSPFVVRVIPARFKPDPERILHGALYGSACMTLMLLCGVSGPLIDSYFLGGKLDRREIVATKAVCQIVSHGAKFVYFGALVDQAAGLDWPMVALAIAASMVGTTMAKPILERLSDTQYRTWAMHIITAIALVYLAQGSYLLLQ
ncbi:MAG: sulfite exporter TauE/SafE family protein [Alphaproteobacteria bacterium]|nr:sulfite exporter TauE/SafE family protein [Alphaproteobacteria bacterium]